MKKNFGTIFLSALFFVVMAVIVNYSYNITKNIHEQKEISIASKKLDYIASKIEHSIISNSMLIVGLATNIKINKGINPNQFHILATNIYEANHLIVDISVAPDDIIKFVYPYTREKYAMGFNLKTDKVHQEYINQFSDNKTIKIISPTIIPGEIDSIIISYPIHLNNGNDYWGRVNLPLYTQKIYEQVGLKQDIEDMSFAIKDNYGKVFFGDKKVFENKQKQIQIISLYDDNWEIAVAFNSNHKAYDPEWIRFIGIILSIIFTVLLYKLNTTKQRLNNTNKKMKKYIDIIDKFVITSSTDLDGNITYTSKAFCEVSGYSKNELIGKNHNILRHEDMPKKTFEKLWKTISEDKVWEGEIKNKKKTGEFYWVKSSISPIYENNKKIGYTSIRYDISDKKKIEEISITDALTNLYNRRHFNDIFPKIINAGKRNNEYIAFCILDIDFFKQYNDTYGHQAGDLVLEQVSKLLKNELKRASDLVFRLGGEEFGVVIRNQEKDEVLNLFINLKEKIENLNIIHSKNKASKYITSSFGLVVLKAQDIKHEDYLYKLADDMLYKAKEQGRNRVVSYS